MIGQLKSVSNIFNEKCFELSINFQNLFWFKYKLIESETSRIIEFLPARLITPNCSTGSLKLLNKDVVVFITYVMFILLNIDVVVFITYTMFIYWF